MLPPSLRRLAVRMCPEDLAPWDGVLPRTAARTAPLETLYVALDARATGWTDALFDGVDAMVAAFRSGGWLDPATTAVRLVLYQRLDGTAAGVRRIAGGCIAGTADPRRHRIVVVVDGRDVLIAETDAHADAAAAAAVGMLRWMVTYGPALAVEIILRFRETRRCGAYPTRAVYERLRRAPLSGPEAALLRDPDRFRVVAEALDDRAHAQGDLI